jgi:hypothetical protein
MEIGTTPWWLALVTAVWFALMAQRAGRSGLLWGISGGLFALVAATLILGLGRAMTIPFSDHDRAVARMQWTIAVVLVIAPLGLLFTLGLLRQTMAPGPSAQSGTNPAPANPPERK